MRFGERWPRLAFVALTIATGLGMTAFAARARFVTDKVGLSTALSRLVTIACPALIGVGILVFGFALLGRRRSAPRAGEATVGERGYIVRLTVFFVPILVVTQMAAARLAPAENAEDGSWSALVVAALVPLVPVILIGFFVLIQSAARLFADSERPHHTPVLPRRRH